MPNSVASQIQDKNGVVYDIVAKGLDGTRNFALTGDVTGTQTSDLSGNVSIASTIANNAVTTSKIDDSAVTTGKINDGAVSLAKIDSTAKATTITSTSSGKLATEGAVADYVQQMISGQGSYLGIKSVAQINAMTTSDLHLGDHAIMSDSGTLTLGSVSVNAGDTIYFFTSGSTSVWQVNTGNYKTKQSAYSSNGSTIKTVTAVSQNTNGEVDVTYSTIRSASTSQSGVMSAGDKTKLDGIASGAQVNVLESVKVNGSALPITDKSVNVTCATTAQGTKADTAYGWGNHASAGYATSSEVASGLASKLDSNAVVTSWSETTSDSNVPSEKLAKDSLDAKFDKANIDTATPDTPTNSHVMSSLLISTLLGGKSDSNHTHPELNALLLTSSNNLDNLVTEFPSLSTKGELWFYYLSSSKPSNIPSAIASASGTSLVHVVYVASGIWYQEIYQGRENLRQYYKRERTYDGSSYTLTNWHLVSDADKAWETNMDSYSRTEPYQNCRTYSCVARTSGEGAYGRMYHKIATFDITSASGWPFTLIFGSRAHNMYLWNILVSGTTLVENNFIPLGGDNNFDNNPPAVRLTTSGLPSGVNARLDLFVYVPNIGTNRIHWSMFSEPKRHGAEVTWYNETYYTSENNEGAEHLSPSSMGTAVKATRGVIMNKDVQDTYSASSEDPISGKGVAQALGATYDSVNHRLCFTNIAFS